MLPPRKLITQDRNDTFSDSYEHSVNAVAFYENEYYSARAAYTWRSEYMIRETGFYGAREHQDYGSLDLSFTYKFNDNLHLIGRCDEFTGRRQRTDW